MGRVCFPSPFGIWTRRTGGARYVPDFARSSSAARFPSRVSAYSSALCPSTPFAPPFRVRRCASRSQSMSMWWASVVSCAPESSFASFAIRCNFVETVNEPNVSAIFPPNSSVSRCRSLLRRVPWDGSPASQPPIAALRLLASPLRSAFVAPLGGAGLPESTSPPRFLGNPYIPALLNDPGGTLHPEPRPGWPAFWTERCSLPRNETRRPHDDVLSGLLQHGPHARCLRFAVALTARPRKTRFRLAAPCLGRLGLSPTGRFDRFQLGYITFLRSQAFPGAIAINDKRRSGLPPGARS